MTTIYGSVFARKLFLTSLMALLSWTALLADTALTGGKARLSVSDTGGLSKFRYSATALFPAASCTGPVSLFADNSTATSARLTWYSLTAGATELSYTPASQSATGPWTTVSSLTASFSAYSYSLTNLMPNTTYAWRVREFCSATDSSDYVAGPGFRGECSIPAIAATDDVSSYGALLAWPTTDAAPRYTVQYQPVSTTGSTWITLPGLNGAQYALPGLTNGTTYVWRVQSVCSASATSAFSNTIAFTTACRVPTVSVESVNRTSASLSWNFDYGVSYVVQWRPKSTTATSTTMAWANTSPVLNEFEFSGYVYSEPFTINNLTPGTGYEYQIKAVCADGVSSAFSPVDTFTTTACTTTTPESANSIPAYNSALLYWSSPADVHDLRWRPAGATGWNVATDIVGSSLSIRGLTGNTVYEWQVRGFCAGQAGPFSALQSFTTTCGLPAFLTNCQTNTAARLTWNGPPGAAFDLQWRAMGGTWTPVNSLTTNDYTLTGLKPATAHEWQVRTVCGSGQSSAFATAVQFQTSASCPIPANVLAAAYASSCGQAFLSWSGCSGSLVAFEVQYKPQSSAMWSAASQVVAGTFLAIDKLAEGTAYDFRVRAVCSRGDTSAFVTTPVLIPACPCAVIAGISHNRISNSTAFLQWDGSKTAIRYEVRWRVGKTTGWSSATTTSQFYQLTNLTTDTPYDWQVRPVCAGGTTADYSLIGFFRTVCNTPGGLRTSNVTALSATVSWDFIPGVQYEIRYRTGVGTYTTISPITGSVYSLTGLTDNTTYEWQVKAMCNGGGSSDYAGALFFTTQCPKPTTKFADEVSQTSARLNWSGSSAAGYDLQYRPVGAASFSAVSVGQVFSYSLVGLLPGTAYDWQIRTLCDAGSSTSVSGQSLTFQTLTAVSAGREAVTMQTKPVDYEPIVLSISPNPADADVRVQIQLAAPGPVTVSVLNVQGRLLRGWQSGQDNQTHEATFDLSGWPAGLYLIRAEAGGRVVVQKLIKR